MTPKTSLARRAYFSAGRQLHFDAWTEAQNHAAYGRDVLPHGFDATLDVFYAGAVDDENGMIVNLTDLKPVLSRVLNSLDGHFLDRDVEHFTHQPPTAENLAQFIWDNLPSYVGSGTLSRVLLQEGTRLTVRKEPQAMNITRSYEFAAAHRLHVPQMSESDNATLFGKCNNPSGHGHNYGLDVTVTGTPDARSGLIIPLPELDAIVEQEIFERFDHKHLNVDCADFRELVPTSENLARVIFGHLQRALEAKGYRLAKIGLHETTKNYFEVEAVS